MKSSAIIYETYYGTSKKVAQSLALILANSKVFSIDDAPEDISRYANIITVFSFHGTSTAEKTKKYLKSIKDSLEDKTLGLIGVGLSEKDLSNHVQSIESEISFKANYSKFVPGELRIKKLTDDDLKTLEKFLTSQNMKLMDMGKFKIEDAVEVAVSIKESLDKPEHVVDDETLKKSIHEFILSHNTCTLATGANGFIRATPIEYVFIDDVMYFITEGGYKFTGILQNPNVCISIFNDYTNFQDLKGLQMTGKAEIVEIGSEEYIKVMNEKKLKMENLMRLPVSLNLVKVPISKYEFLNSDFKKLGAEAKQTLNMLV